MMPGTEIGKWPRPCNKNQIKVLQNEGLVIKTAGGAFYLAGVEDFDTGHPDIERALARSEGPVILLSHSPDVFPAVPPQVVLTLAGHTHGGQIYIPGIGAPVSSSVYGQRYIRGLIEEEGRRMLVTVGTGTSVLPLRFGSVPEIVVIDWQKIHPKFDKKLDSVVCCRYTGFIKRIINQLNYTDYGREKNHPLLFPFRHLSEHQSSDV